jgi:hypothetical protein
MNESFFIKNLFTFRFHYFFNENFRPTIGTNLYYLINKSENNVNKFHFNKKKPLEVISEFDIFMTSSTKIRPFSIE